MNNMPLSGHAGTGGLNIEGGSVEDPNNRPHAAQRMIDDHYFEAMGIPLRRGRNFGSDESPTSLRVAIVNEAAVRRYWPGQDSPASESGRTDFPKVCG